MNIALQFIRSCVLTSSATEDDIGYMMKDYFQYVDINPSEQNVKDFFLKINNRINEKFFDKSNSIKRAFNSFDHYHKLI